LLYVAGTGSFAFDVAEIAADAGMAPAALIELRDPSRVGSRVHGLPVVALGPPPEDDATVLVGAGGDRRPICEELDRNGWTHARVVHPSAHVPPSAKLGTGVLLGPGAILGAAASIGAHALIARGALIGHHTRIGAFSTVNPGVNVAGNANVGEDAFLGVGCVVSDHVEIGAAATVAAGAVVISDVEPGTRVRGVPARPWGNESRR
jgi:sugar O-acyltransferase (sialic acid O-acetyltransferase NeuD family)